MSCEDVFGFSWAPPADSVPGEDPVKLNGIVEDIIFKNDENGYAVVRIEDDEARPVTVTGIMPYIAEGDTISAVRKFGVAEEVSYISTGGGAFLEFLEGKTLPAVAALEARADG